MTPSNPTPDEPRPTPPDADEPGAPRVAITPTRGPCPFAPHKDDDSAWGDTDQHSDA